ncbi:MAG: glycine cleavage system protein T [Verrucomicrobia bacterium CG_4_9_14_3_um_filter_43_20]|nr:MAG: glycine cleavage system protein T [Verrucomicrobia bacterium CG_4_9_14_3_um_filter_43_20]
MTETLSKTPLHEFHERHGARFVPFAGWQMPVQYTSIIEEHKGVREQAGLFDVSHMGEVLVRGSQAGMFLDYIMTNAISNLKPGKAVYSLMCNENGEVIDDVIVTCLNIAEYMVCLNASNAQKDIIWMLDQSVSFDCLIKDVSMEYALLALQGPKAQAILEAVTSKEWKHLKRFHVEKVEIDGIEVLVSRTGYTGEDGFELYCPWDEGGMLAELIYEKGKSLGLILAGLGARDSLRLEAGYPLYGHEISETVGPLEAGLEWVIKWGKKNDFIGRMALETRNLNAGVTQTVVFYILDDRRIAREGAEVFSGDELVGRVLSGSFSPMIGKAIGSALIKKAYAASQDLCVDIRGTRLPLQIKKPPLHKS